MGNTSSKKICIVGCGAIARVHAKHLREKAELHFVSRRRESAEALCSEFGGTTVYDNYEQALQATIDGVVICTPPEYHAEQTIVALQHEKGVLVEKPLCADEDALTHLAQAVATHPDVPFLVAENYYYKPSLERLRWILEQGFIGPLQSIRVRKCSMQAAVGWKSGYGALLEGGIHFIALISGLVDLTPISVRAHFPNRIDGEAERHSHVHMDYDSGLNATLHYAWNVPSLTKGVFQHSRIEGEAGHILFESNGLYMCLSSPERSGFFFPGLRDLMGYDAQARDFIACLTDPKRTPRSGFAQAQRDLNIVFQAYRGIWEKRS